MDFFAADLRRFGARQFAGVAYEQLPPEQLRAKFEELRAHFRSAVHEAFRADDCHNNAWCQRILSTLFLEGNESQTEQLLSGLSPEFFLQVEWLPGGRFEEGEFLFDSIFDEAASHPEDAELQRLCDPRAKGIIFNFIREYGDLEYINVGCVPESLSLDRPQQQGRRGVFLAEFRSRSERAPVKRFMRLQKWGVWEHLDEGKDLLQSIKESDDYTDYCLDRRLGCRQLGMNLTRRVAMRRLSEIYHGTNARFRGEPIRTIYFEREYLPGIATDKLPLEKYARPGYAPRLAALLGRAAASSIIVGRALEPGTRARCSTTATKSCGKARTGCRPKSWWATTAAPLANTSCRWRPSPPITPGPVNARDKIGARSARIRHRLPGRLSRAVPPHPGRLPQAPPRLRHPLQALQIRHRRQLRLPLGMRPAPPGPDQSLRAGGCRARADLGA